MIKSKKTALLAAGIMFAATNFAQNNFGEIRGKVFEKENNLPSIGANAWVKVNGSITGSPVNDKGEFVIKPLSPGNYVLYITSVGKDTLKTTVTVNPDEICNVKTLFLSDGVELKPFEVPIPPIHPEETSKKTIRWKELEKNPNLRDPAKLLTSYHSDIKASENGDVYVRGSRSDASIYFIDGVKSAGNIKIPGVAIGSLTVYTGGVPAKYGDVTSGVIIIETKSYFDLYYESLLR